MQILNYDNSEFDIIVLAGQSNAYGSGIGPCKTPWKEREDILMLKNSFTCQAISNEEGEGNLLIIPIKEGFIERAKERFDKKYNENSTNLSYSFAKKYAEKYLQKDRKILIVNTAVGGTGFKSGHWRKGDQLFKRMFDMVNSALKLNKNNKIVACLWHQGECEIVRNKDLSFEDGFKYYHKHFTELFNSLRNTYGKDIPFICGGFTHTLIDKYELSGGIVLDVLKNVMAENKNTKFVETFDLKSNADLGSDIFHFCNDALSILGERYFDAYQQIMNYKERK